MKTQQVRGAVWGKRRLIGWGLATLAVVGGLLLYKLGNLTGGLSQTELATASAPLGWHNIYLNPLDLPLKAVRSAVFWAFPEHGQSLTRLPNVLFGALAIASFGVMVRLWHGTRTAVLSTALFATAAWVLHTSRLASLDVLYLWSMTTLLASHFVFRRYPEKPLVWYANIAVWGVLLYVPGLVWLVLADMVMQRKLLLRGWKSIARWWQRIFYVLASLIWLPLLVSGLLRPGHLQTWLGAPGHFVGFVELLKQFAAVPLHLFVRGPQYPELWLGKAPILDVFTLVACALGIYFYASHRKASRSRHLAVFAVLGWLLVAAGGPVGLSLLVPLLYMAAATGLAYLLHDWLKTFPNNPLARGLGIGLVIFAVCLSCLYNTRAYFIAWPHSDATKTAFQYHRQP